MDDLTNEEISGIMKAADYLDSCTKCGEIHKFVWKDDNNHKLGGTWASPDDGHAYSRRGQGADLLRSLVIENG